ncbi:hypothetical protein ELQ16_00545 [Campylobacter sp. US33a]|nr:hypothetical protein ELQ16_00545 [Campylobacter sp. US33a]
MKNKIKHKILFKIKVKMKRSSKALSLIMFVTPLLCGGSIFVIWHYFDAIYKLPYFFELENENLQDLWKLNMGFLNLFCSIAITLMFFCINIIIVCEDGIYIITKYNLFYKTYIKREDLELFEVEKMKLLNQAQTCLIVKSKNKTLFKGFEDMYKKEDLEKLKIWYENKL